MAEITQVWAQPGRMWLKIERLFDIMEGDDLVGNHDACGPNHAAAGGDGRAAAADRTCLRPATLFNELGGFMVVAKSDMMQEIMEGLNKLPHKYVKFVLIVVRGLLKE